MKVVSITKLFLNVVVKGSSANLMKSGSVRRRTKIQIEEEKKQEKLKKAEIEAKLARFEQMEAKIAELT